MTEIAAPPVPPAPAVQPHEVPAPAPVREPADQTTEEILAGLAGLGLAVDRRSLRAQAGRTGSPEALAAAWQARLSPSPPLEPLHAAARELWVRWLPDLGCAEVLAEEFDRRYEPLDTLLFGNPHALREALERALKIADACGPTGGPIQPALFEEIWARTYHDLALWLRCLPHVLAQRELWTEAIGLCERLAPIFDTRAFLADRALLLAQAGRPAEALRQAQANIRHFRRDPGVLRKTCETLWALGRAEEAMLLYDEVLEFTHGRPAAAAPISPNPREEMRP